jgi:hypothetical protein
MPDETPLCELRTDGVDLVAYTSRVILYGCRAAEASAAADAEARLARCVDYGDLAVRSTIRDGEIYQKAPVG